MPLTLLNISLQNIFSFQILEGLQVYRQKKNERLQIRRDRNANKKAANASQEVDKDNKERRAGDDREEEDDDIIEIDD